MAPTVRPSRGARHLPVLMVLLILVLTLAYGMNATAATPGSVVINEVAWMGTQASSTDEWIELSNNTEQAIDMTGWGIFEVSTSGVETLIEPLTGTIQPKALYLLERTDETTVSDILSDQLPSGWGGSGLSNSGEHLILKDSSGIVIDEVNALGGWFAGKASPSFRTMERIDPLQPGNNPANWATNNGIVRNGLDANGNPINGTPKAQNSTVNLAPVAHAGPDQIVNEGATITLDGSASTDPNSDYLICTWDPGDSSGTLDGCVVAHTYGDNGIFTVTLTADDGRGGTSTDSAQIAVNNVPPTVEAGADLTASVGDLIRFSGSFTDPGTADTHTILWDFGDGNTTNEALNPTHSYSTTGAYTVTLTVADDDGGVGVDTLTVIVSTPPRKGDANGDEVIDLLDAILCAEFALELKTPTNLEGEACDVAFPLGKIDGRDVVRIAEISLGIASTRLTSIRLAD